MALRWTGAAMQEAAKGFKRLKAHKQLPLLKQALAQSTRRKPSPRTSILLAPQRPHSLHASDARFAFFNIRLDIPKRGMIRCNYTGLRRSVRARSK
jgi:hypothetical protein